MGIKSGKEYVECYHFSSGEYYNYYFFHGRGGFCIKSGAKLKDFAIDADFSPESSAGVTHIIAADKKNERYIENLRIPNFLAPVSLIEKIEELLIKMNSSSGLERASSFSSFLESLRKLKRYERIQDES